MTTTGGVASTPDLGQRPETPRVQIDADGSDSASWGVTDSQRVNPWFDGVEYGQENNLTWRDVPSANCR